MVPKTDPAIRFWKKVTKGNPDECWVWSGLRSPRGYGIFVPNPTHERPRPPEGRDIRAHRFAWELFFGAIPAGMFVCHRCDNPPCVNPGHLFLGTHKDNMHDMSIKGRVKAPMGEKQWAAKLTVDRVKEIRNGVDGRWSTIKHFAKKFGVSTHTIHLAAIGKNWKHVV